MADDFDSWLANALAPEERAPDRAFVRKVQASVVLEQRLETERRRLLSRLVLQLLGLVAVAAALYWLGRAPELADFAAQSPAVALAALIAGFSFLLLLFGSRNYGEQVLGQVGQP